MEINERSDIQLTLFGHEEPQHRERINPEPDLHEIYTASMDCKRERIPDAWGIDAINTDYVSGFLTGVRWMIYRNRVRQLNLRKMIIKFGINYKLIYLRLKRKFPYIESLLNHPSRIKSFEEVPGIYLKFKEIYDSDQNNDSEWDEKLIILAVIVLMDDPEFFDDTVPIRKGLASAMGSLLNCDRTVISHSLRTVKNYKQIYPHFWSKVQYFYDQLTKE